MGQLMTVGGWVGGGCVGGVMSPDGVGEVRVRAQRKMLT